MISLWMPCDEQNTAAIWSILFHDCWYLSLWWQLFFSLYLFFSVGCLGYNVLVCDLLEMMMKIIWSVFLTKPWLRPITNFWFHRFPLLHVEWSLSQISSACVISYYFALSIYCFMLVSFFQFVLSCDELWVFFNTCQTSVILRNRGEEKISFWAQNIFYPERKQCHFEEFLQ